MDFDIQQGNYIGDTGVVFWECIEEVLRDSGGLSGVLRVQQGLQGVAVIACQGYFLVFQRLSGCLRVFQMVFLGCLNRFKLGQVFGSVVVTTVDAH